MASGGFYLMHRGWQDHPVFRGEQFSRRDAFVWMIEEAAWTERRVSTPQGIVNLMRGQFSHSIRFMANAWGWEQTKVARFIKAMVADEMLATETATATATAQKIITICNYDKYQIDARPDATAPAVATPQQRHSNATNKKEVKEGNEGNDSAGAESTRKRASPVLKPDGVPQEVWDDFRRLRKEKRAPLTDTAIAGIGREARKAGISLNEALTMCCSRGWQGFKAEWVEQNGGRNGTARNGTGSGGGQVNGFRAAIDRATELLGPDDDY